MSRVWNVLHWWMDDPEAKARILAAHAIRESHEKNDPQYRNVLHEIKPGQRSSRELGDVEFIVPYLRDVIDHGCSDPDCSDADIVMFVNSDCSFLPESVDEVRNKLQNVPCCFSRRIDVDGGAHSLRRADLEGKPIHPGADLFAFRVGWWHAAKHELPDFLIGYDAFDPVVRWWMWEHGDAEIRPPVIYHQRHPSRWEEEKHNSNAGRLHNHRLCKAFAESRGYAKEVLIGEPGHKFRVRLDKEWRNRGSPTKLFLPFLGEFGWKIMHHVRLVHFTEATRKIVCCQRGEECLYPAANEFVYDWKHPIPDDRRLGTDRRKRDWPLIEDRFPDAEAIQAGNIPVWLEAKQVIRIDQRIGIKPYKIRGLSVDVCIGVRARGAAPDRNYTHWPVIARGLRERGLTYAVIGMRATSYPLPNATCMSGDYGDVDAAVELLQSCRLFIGTDSGAAHLASLVNACPMIVQQCPSGSRNFIDRMAATTDHPVTMIGREHWNQPGVMVEAILNQLTTPDNSSGLVR
jgi:hypothetical protein